MTQVRKIGAAGQIPGLTTGATIVSPNIGEQPTPYSSSSLISQGTGIDTYVDSGATLTLQPGVWQITAQAYLQFSVSGGTATNGLIGEVVLRTGSTVVRAVAVCVGNGNVSQAFGSAPVIAVVNIPTPTTYKISTNLRTISGAVTVSSYNIRGDYYPTTISAVRIA